MWEFLVGSLFGVVGSAVWDAMCHVIDNREALEVAAAKRRPRRRNKSV